MPYLSTLNKCPLLWPPCIAGCGHIYFHPVVSSFFYLFLFPRYCLLYLKGASAGRSSSSISSSSSIILSFIASPYAIRPLSVCPVCNVGVLWPNGWMDQDETWRACRPRPWPHCVGQRPSSPSSKGHNPLPISGPYLLWLNGWMDQDATW